MGIDSVPAAIEAAKRKGTSGAATYVLGGVTDLPATDLGTFDFSLTSPASRVSTPSSVMRRATVSRPWPTRSQC